MPESPPPASSSTQASPPSRAPGSPSPEGSPPIAPSGPPARPDPAEEITPRELASIPDPVPGSPSDGAGVRLSSSPAASGAQAEPLAPEDARAGAAGGSAATAVNPGGPTTGAVDPTASGKRSVWRVQIYASPMLQEADRVAKDASAKLGQNYVLEFEGTLYKVRLGAFDTEDAARDLRERAIRLGYAGAFRMREDSEASSTKE